MSSSREHCRPAFLFRTLACLTLFAGLNACSKIEDLQPDAGTIPEETLKLVRQRLPLAEQVDFSQLIPEKVWLAEGYMQSTIHSVVASRSDILSHYSTTASHPTIAIEQIIVKSAFRGGQIFTVRSSELSTPHSREYQADYMLSGQRYLLSWKEETAGDRTAYSMTLHPRAYRQFVSRNFDDLPEEIKKLPVPRAEFKRVVVTEEGNGAVFQLEFEKGILELDDEMTIFFSDLGNTPEEIADDELLPDITEWLAKNPLNSPLSGPMCQKFNFNGSEGYRLVYSGETENKYIFFDKFGKFKYLYYTTHPIT